MIPRYRFKNAQTRQRFCELAQDPEVQPGCLRALAHISPRIPEADWMVLCRELQVMLLQAAGARRCAG
jgi:hypothetical protein